MERTRKLTDTHRKDQNYIPQCILHMPGGITRDMVHVFCMSSHGLTFL